MHMASGQCEPGSAFLIFIPQGLCAVSKAWVTLGYVVKVLGVGSMLTVRIWAAGLTVLMALTACSGQEPTEVLLERARESLAAGKVNAAVIDIKTALQQETANPEARLLYGRAYMMQNDPASAASEFRRAASRGSAEAEPLYAQALVGAGLAADLVDYHEKSGPAAPQSRNPAYLAALSRAYSESGDMRTAAKALEQASQVGTEDAYLLVSRALLEMRSTGETDAAATLLQRATAEYPQDAEAWSVRAYVARLEGKPEAAADFYARSTELNPGRLADRLGLVDVLLQLGRTATADTEIARLEKVLPDHPGVNFARGRMLVQSGQYAAGLQELSRVLGNMPRHAGSLYLAGAANAREGNLATAQSQLTQFLDGQPGHLPARLELANVYLQMQEHAAAEDVARRVLEADPQSAVAMRLLATALGAQGLFAESAQVYSDLAEVEPEAVDARVGLGTTRLLSGDSAGGLVELRAALEKDPGNDGLRERLIATEMALGNIESAVNEVNAYRKYSDDSQRALVFAGRVALGSGDGEDARRLFERVLSMEPHNLDANGGLAALALLDRDIDAARKRFQDSLEGHPGDLATLMNLAVLAERTGDFGAMEEALLAAIRSNKDAVRPRVALARYRTGLGDPEAAIRLLSEVERANAGSYALHHALASAHLANDAPAFALDSARRALELQPQEPGALLMAARAEQANGRYGIARTHIEKSLSLREDVNTRKLLVENLLQQNELDAAREQIAALPDADRMAPGVQTVLGRIAMAQERYAEAESLFQSLFEAEADSGSLLYLTAARWEQGKQAEVIGLLQSWLADNPGDLVLRNQLATRYLTMGNEVEAREEYQRLIKEAPDNPMVLNNLAWLERDRDPEQALSYVKRALELAPDSIQIIDTYAMVEHARGNFEAAMELSAKALAAAPDMPDLRLNRARILLDTGRRNEAHELLEDLLAGPESTRHAEARALLEEL